MYHYVRDVDQTRYPGIKARRVDEFRGQLDHIVQNYTVCSVPDLVDAARGRKQLPENSCHLTFDDGLIDHYTTVFPELVSRGMTASFYPSAFPTEEPRVLDVHKIQHILACSDDDERLLRKLFEIIDELRNDYDLPSNDVLRSRHARKGRWDSEKVVLVKRLLQACLPKEVRRKATQRLFESYVGVSEQVLARELYMSVPQMRIMAKVGMSFGGHGYSHEWIGTLPEQEQEFEIKRSMELVEEITGSTEDWVMCHPSNSCTELTICLLMKYGCVLGFKAEPGCVIDFEQPYELLRSDTNDLPVRVDAKSKSQSK